MGFVWGLCWASIRLRFGGFPYRWSRLIAGSKHNKQGAENTQKELQGKGRFSLLDIREGLWQLLTITPSLSRPSRRLTSRQEKNTSFFWPHFLGDPSSTPNRIERVSFFFSIFLGPFICLVPPLGWLTLSVGTRSSSDDTTRLFFLISVQAFNNRQDTQPSKPDWTTTRKGGTRDGGWKAQETLLSLSHSLSDENQHLSFVNSNNTTDSRRMIRHGWVDTAGLQTWCRFLFSCARSWQSEDMTPTLLGVLD